MDVEQDIRPRLHQVLVAALVGGPAKVLGGELALLQHGAHGAVHHQDALAQGGVERRAAGGGFGVRGHRHLL